jgi:hypothetical protein
MRQKPTCALLAGLAVALLAVSALAGHAYGKGHGHSGKGHGAHHSAHHAGRSGLVATEFGVGFPRCRQRACWPSRRGRSVGPPHFAGADHGLTKTHRSVRQGNGQLPRWAMASRRGHPAGDSCGSGSWGGRCPSLADYVAGMSPRAGAIAAGRVLELATLRVRHLIACGLIGEPVPPVMTSGGAQ